MLWCDIEKGDVLMSNHEFDKSVYLAVSITEEMTKWLNISTGDIFFTKRGSEQILDYFIMKVNDK